MTSNDDDLLGLPAGLPYRATLSGVGYALPRGVFTNAQVEATIDAPEGWLEPRTGISERRWAAPDENVLTLGEEAAANALEMAGLTVADIDHIIFATYTFDRMTPNAAPFLAERMGFPTSTAAIDVNAACAGWLSGLKFGTAMVESGRAENVLVLASDVISRFGSIGEKGGVAVMADGAGAGILTRRSADHPGAIGELTIHADGSYADMIGGLHSTERAWMRGQETYMVAVAELVKVTKEVLEKGSMTLDDPDLYVFHQANGRILKAVGARLDLPPEKSVTYLADTGNISAATIPMALTRARADGKLRQGHLICTAAIGAGYVWGGGLLRWGIPDPA
ncbi:MAG: ketoacyl-ACP synthase III [Solirubrobacteraceae bacterium]|nr:ketoacyl-ACP synthase III [Solirubrobacteraceae bacterium]